MFCQIEISYDNRVQLAEPNEQAYKYKTVVNQRAIDDDSMDWQITESHTACVKLLRGVLVTEEKKQAAGNLNDKVSDQVNDNRRKAVRNLLTGAGVTAGVGALANSAWMEPVINTVMLPAHAQTSMPAAPARCCPYYFDATQNWCYELAMPGGGGGPLPGGFSVYNWDQPPGCPTP